jgi:hypothetical protein
MIYQNIQQQGDITAVPGIKFVLSTAQGVINSCFCLLLGQLLCKAAREGGRGKTVAKFPKRLQQCVSPSQHYVVLQVTNVLAAVSPGNKNNCQPKPQSEGR